MEAIKKKMQAMKVEKDMAMDKCDVAEEPMKAAKIRASKAEDEVVELTAKSNQLETELDLTSEKCGIISLSLADKEKALQAAKLEMNALNKRGQSIKGHLEVNEEQTIIASSKLYKSITAVDDSE